MKKRNKQTKILHKNNNFHYLKFLQNFIYLTKELLFKMKNIKSNNNN